ncbi:hypothetical protein KO494_13080 [Lacinutrix sp. C3R15]|uniref:DUF3592 domain-containing protein n=1 Tax=Flavobacteriaceae TaxID=49546 RepID=UPI001C086F4B|nr:MULTISPECIES: hypothetical protein [Flavobacteriaceae]MBU2940474.1 hypothetical protein [Lacinutrix sp. C3R15]MDO6623794.1 hypothetical protein [Oceanihabitans sp. 1_MG-2023]
MNKNKITAILIIVAICVLYYFFNYKQKREVIDFGVSTNTKIINYSYGSQGKNWVTYKYSVDGIEYEGQEAVSSFKCDEEDNNKKGCVGMTFKVVYSKRNPEISEINLGKYNKYKLTKL